MNNREIENQFQKSWIETELFFDNLIGNGFSKLIPIKKLIIDLSQRGNNKYFRLGTSMYTLIFSRSVDFGLRPNQKNLRVEVKNKNYYNVRLGDADSIDSKYDIQDISDDKIINLLEILKNTPID